MREIRVAKGRKLGFAVAAPGLCLAIMFLVATADGASAANSRSAVVVQISGKIVGTADAVTDPRCLGQQYTVSGKATYEGTLDGVGDFCNKAKPPLVEPDGLGLLYYEEHTFVGTVRGCGTGTFRYTVDGVSHPLDTDQETIAPADEDWRIVDGSGTGDLVGIRSGLNHRTGAFNTDGNAFAVFDPAMNSLTCIPAQPQSRSGAGVARLHPKRNAHHHRGHPHRRHPHRGHPTPKPRASR